MKFRLPKGCARLSHAGKVVAIASDGSVDLDPRVASLLGPHGIVPVGDPVPIDLGQLEAMARADLVATLAARQVDVSPRASEAALRSLLRQALAKPSL